MPSGFIQSNTDFLNGTTTGKACAKSLNIIIQFSSIYQYAFALLWLYLNTCSVENKHLSVKCHRYIELNICNSTKQKCIATVMNMSSTMLLLSVIIFLVMTIIGIKTCKLTKHSGYPLPWTLIVLKWKLLATSKCNMDKMCCLHNHQLATNKRSQEFSHSEWP